MSKIEALKNNLDSWFENAVKYTVVTEKHIDHPVNKSLMSFNIVFTDVENSIRYTVTCFENEALDCTQEIKTGAYSMSVENFGNSMEALIKIEKFYDGMDEFNFDEMMNIIILDGINNLLY
jgi:hypothetical protein